MKATLFSFAVICLLTLSVTSCSHDNLAIYNSFGIVTGKVVDVTGSPISVAPPLAGVTITTVPATQTVVTDTNGTFTFTDIPAGSYTLTATLAGYADAMIDLIMIEGQTQVLTLPMSVGGAGDSLQTPFNPTPQDGSIAQPTYLTLSWSAGGKPADSLRYDVYLGTTQPLQLVASDQTTPNLLQSALDTGKTYYWRVIVKNRKGTQKSGPEWRFTTTSLLNNNAPLKPTSPAPSNGALSQPYQINLKWDCSDPDNDPLTYDVLLGTDPVPTKIVAENISVKSATVTNLQANTIYYWQVVAKDNHSGVTLSTVWNFTVRQNLAPNTPHTPTPADGAIDLASSLTLRWSASDDDADPLTFDVYISKSNPPVDLIASDITTKTLAQNALEKGVIYYWRVVAKDGHGGIMNGPVWRFSTYMQAAPGLIAYYPFNGNANDESDNGHHGTVHGATLTTDRHGVPNRAYLFGSSKYITVSNSSRLTMAQSDFTVTAWVKLTGSQSDYAGILVKCTPTAPEKGYQLVVRHEATLGGQYGTNIPQSPVYFDVIGGALTQTNWHFVAMVIDRSAKTVKLYVDGILQKTVVDDHLSYSMDNSSPLYIGVERQKAIYFNGAIDDVRVFNYALTDQEILALVN